MHGPPDILILVPNSALKSPVPDILVISAVLMILVVSQSLMKAGAEAPSTRAAGLNGFLAAAYALFLIRGALWALVLRRRPVSRVYPLLSLAYPLVLISGMRFFGESATPGNLAGTALIAVGSALIASEGPRA